MKVAEGKWENYMFKIWRLLKENETDLFLTMAPKGCIDCFYLFQFYRWESNTCIIEKIFHKSIW